jgi:hypothetical protein
VLPQQIGADVKLEYETGGLKGALSIPITPLSAD